MEPRQFEVNQRVQIRSAKSPAFAGRKGTIKEIAPTEHPRDYMVQIDTGEVIQFNEYELVLEAD